MDLDQTRAPYLEAVIAYVARDPARLHIPGHKGEVADPELVEAIGVAAFEHDVPSGIEGIDIGPAPTAFQAAQALAADAWGAERSWFLLNGASQGNHVACLALAHLGGEVVVQRNAHSSTVDGLVMSGLVPTFVQPEVDPDLGIAHCVTPESLGAALASTPDAAGAMIVSPTYFGAVADVEALAEVAHERGVPLVVDEAWGAHMYFDPELPAGALAHGADLVISSTHKIVGSLGQSAILHLGGSGLLTGSLIDRCVTLVETTSPSALLTASLDGARRIAAVQGVHLLSAARAEIARARERVRSLPGAEVLDSEVSRTESVVAWDEMRIPVDVRASGATGHRIAEVMRVERDVHVELFTENVVEAVFGMSGDTEREADRFVDALELALSRVEPADRERRRAFATAPPWGPLEMSPREAFLGPQEQVSFAQAEGRIAAESLAAYPPGVPNVLPGERLTAETLAYIGDLLASGGMVRGATDKTLETLRVVSPAA